jgi:hypothetical protein
MQPSKIDGSYDNQAGSHGSSQSSLGEAYNSESGESLNIDSLMPHELHHRNNLIEATGLQENRHLQANKYHISKVSKADKEHSRVDRTPWFHYHKTHLSSLDSLI